MQQNFIDEEKIKELSKVDFIAGDIKNFDKIGLTPTLKPFDDNILEFLNELSKRLMSDSNAKKYSDIITLAFWIRKASMLKLKERFVKENKFSEENINNKKNTENEIHLGRGVAFHIAPSNVPVNYAYSLVTGLVTGNINIVRIPSKDYPQVTIINDAILKTINDMTLVKDYIYIVRYERSQTINDIFSSIADVRIVWGGDNTIAELRKSGLRPRATEITFADRYSLAIINADMYMETDRKDRLAEDFYNDTYFTDQNACTSPRIVIWTGKNKKQAKDIFWNKLYEIVKRKYELQPIMGINKLTSSYLLAANRKGVHIEEHADNYLVRVSLDKVDAEIMNQKDNSGYFFEYDCENLIELYDLCNDLHCQTIAYLGEKEDIVSLLSSGIKGVDRVVEIGKTMDFDLIWDGYNLFERMTRTIRLEI